MYFLTIAVLLICVVFEDVMEKCLEVGTFSRVTTLLKRVGSGHYVTGVRAELKQLHFVF